MISRDHHDVSGTDAPFRETSNIEDGSMYCAGFENIESFFFSSRLTLISQTWLFKTLSETRFVEQLGLLFIMAAELVGELQ